MKSRFVFVILILFLVGFLVCPLVTGAVDDRVHDLEVSASQLSRMQFVTTETSPTWTIIEDSPEEGFLAAVANDQGTGQVLGIACSPLDDGTLFRYVLLLWGPAREFGYHVEDESEIPVSLQWYNPDLFQTEREGWYRLDIDGDTTIGAVAPSEVQNFLDQARPRNSAHISYHMNPSREDGWGRSSFDWSGTIPVDGVERCGRSEEETPTEEPAPTVLEERPELEWSFRYLGSQERNDDGGYVGLLEIRTGRERGLFQDLSWDLYLILHTREVVHETAPSASAKVDGSGWIPYVPFLTRNVSPNHHAVAPFIEQGFPNVSVLDLSGESGQELIQAESTVEVNYRASGAPVRTRMTFDLGEPLMARTRDHVCPDSESCPESESCPTCPTCPDAPPPSGNWEKSGSGADVFSKPCSVSKVRITGEFTDSGGENFVIWFDPDDSAFSDLVVNEILGTGSNYSTTYSGTHRVSGCGDFRVKYSTGISWTFTEVP